MVNKEGEKSRTLKEYQEEVDKWFKKKGWRYWKPLAMVARLFEEGGELARLINHLFGEKPKRSDEKKQDLEEELGDLLFTITCIANSQRINLDRALRKSINKVIKRDKDRYNQP